MMKISKEIFRAYDIRGIVGDNLTPEIVYEIGQTLGFQIRQTAERKVIVGRDGRLSGPALIDSLKQGLLIAGIDVIDIGIVPTPLLYFATKYLKVSAGIMLTGSHNPPNYNGLKIIIGDQSLYGAKIAAIYQDILEQKALKISNNEKDNEKGHETSESIFDAYEETLLKDVHLKRKLKIVIDCGNGVAATVAPSLYQRLGCEVIPLFSEVDGNFPNHHPDPSQPKNLEDLIRAVKHHKADIGLAFDGDGDRLGVVDNLGKIIWPDRLLILFAKNILKVHKKASILFDVKCTRHAACEIEKDDGHPIMWKTGHSFIKSKMQETNALLAGEMSGHIFFKDRWFGFDDAIYAGARLLEILSNEKIAANILFEQIPESVVTPEIAIQVQEDKKLSIIEKLIHMASFDKGSVTTMDGLRVDYEDGFGLIRASNTGPNLILRFEGDTEHALLRIKQEFQELLFKVEPSLIGQL